MFTPQVISYSNICLLTAVIFTIADLYFAYTDFSCTHSWISYSKFGFGLGTWLKVSGFTSLFFLAAPILGLCFARSQAIINYIICFAALIIIFRFIWLIIGSIMFWGYLSGTGACSNALNTYMWINLLYSWGLLLISCLTQQQTYAQTSSVRTVNYVVWEAWWFIWFICWLFK